MKLANYLMIGMLGVGAWAGNLWARLPDRPGEIPADSRPAGWLAWVISAILVAAVVIVSVKSAKRSHLD